MEENVPLNREKILLTVYSSFRSEGSSVSLPFTVSEEEIIEWSSALYEENCEPLSRLLSIHPLLVKVTIPDEFKQLAEAKSGQRNGSWKKRTALHVGARRGSFSLVEQLMNMFVISKDNMSRPWWSGVTKIEGVDPFTEILPNFFRDLLLDKDEKYDLDALAMAMVNGNWEITHILAEKSRSFAEAGNPYQIPMEGELPRGYDVRKNSQKQKLGEIIKDVVTEYEKGPPLAERLINELKSSHKKNPDYNFLPFDTYIFHFTFLNSLEQLFPPLEKHQYLNCLREFRRDIFNKVKKEQEKAHEEEREREEDEMRKMTEAREAKNEDGKKTISTVMDAKAERGLRKTIPFFLLDLQDGQGRTAVHVAVEEGTLDEFVNLIPADFSRDYMWYTSPDGKRYTPLQRAVAMRNSKSLDILSRDRRARDSESTLSYGESYNWINLRDFSSQNGCGSSGYVAISSEEKRSSFVLALLHNHGEYINSFLKAVKADGIASFLSQSVPVTIGGQNVETSLLCLAALLGHVPALEAFKEQEMKRGHPMDTNEKHFSYIHLAAAAGRSDLLLGHLESAAKGPELLTGTSKNNGDDYFVCDVHGNTALHHALKGPQFELEPTLLDYMNCQHVFLSREKTREKKKRVNVDYDENRKGCVELLIHYGFSIWVRNNRNEKPSPASHAPDEFSRWWSEKCTEEIRTSHRTFNAAANAISVASTLVATAVLTGPIGFTDIDDYMYHHSGLWKPYFVLQNMAFFLAVAALLISLMTAIPLQQESVMADLDVTIVLVRSAVTLLLPSILCLLMEFSFASYLVLRSRNNITILMSTIGLGQLVCVIVLFLFIIRLARVYSSGRVGLKRVYETFFHR